MKRRRFSRYMPDPQFTIPVVIPQCTTRSLQIKTIGLGGCGIYVPAREARLMKLPEIDLKFQFEGRWIAVKGRVQYCNFMPKAAPGTNYLGLSFEHLEPGLSYVLKTWFDGAVQQGKLLELKYNPERS